MAPLNSALPTEWAAPQMLAWAREQVGLSIEWAEAKIAEILEKRKPKRRNDIDLSVEGLAQEAKISAESIRGWEKGEGKPSLAELELLAETYDCPVGYFFLDNPPAEALVPLDFRGISPDKVKSLSYETRLQLRRFTQLMKYAADWVRAAHDVWQVNLGEAGVEERVDQVVKREVARLGVTDELRGRWASAGESFDGWREAIERQGVFVIALKLAPREIRGASSWNQPDPPGILVNREDIEAVAGRTFTMLHEYAHLLLKRSGVACDFRGSEQDGQVERFANRFAAEAIVPREQFKKYLQEQGLYGYRSRWGDDLLRKLKAPFGASKDTIAILIEEMNLAPPGFYREKRRVWDRQKPGGFGGGGGGRPTEIQMRLRDMGIGLSSLMAVARGRELVSDLELAQLLDLKVERTREFVKLARPPNPKKGLT